MNNTLYSGYGLMLFAHILCENLYSPQRNIENKNNSIKLTNLTVIIILCSGYRLMLFAYYVIVRRLSCVGFHAF